MSFSNESFKFYALTRFKLGISADQCLTELFQVYNNDAPSRASIFRWFKDFEGSEDYRPENLLHQPRSGRPRSTRTDENVRAVQALVNEDRRVSIRELADWLEIGKSTVHEILISDLKLQNVASVWVPHELQEKHKLLRVNCAKQIRRVFFREGMDEFIDKLAVQDETWVYLNPVPCKQSNRCWLGAGDSRPQVVKPSISDSKVMLLFAFTPNKRFSATVLPRNQTVDGETIIKFIRHTGDLWRTLRSKPIHMDQLFWQWDNARPHTSRPVSDYLEKRNITKVWQSPYSPDLNLCDRFLFTWMKSDFEKRRFEDHSDVQTAALQWARRLDGNVLRDEVQKLVDYCQLVIESGGSYCTK